MLNPTCKPESATPRPLPRRWRPAALTLSFILALGALASPVEAADSFCTIVSIDRSAAVVKAKETATGKTFQFKVQDATLLRSLRPGLSLGVEPALSALRTGQRFSLVLGTQAGRLEPQRVADCCELIPSPSGPAGAQAPSASRAQGPSAPPPRVTKPVGQAPSASHAQGPSPAQPQQLEPDHGAKSPRAPSEPAHPTPLVGGGQPIENNAVAESEPERITVEHPNRGEAARGEPVFELSPQNAAKPGEPARGAPIFELSPQNAGVAGLKPGGPGDHPTPSLCPVGLLPCPADATGKHTCVAKLEQCKPPSQGPKGEKCPLHQVWCMPQKKCIDWDKECPPQVEPPEYGNTYEPSSQSVARPSGAQERVTRQASPRLPRARTEAPGSPRVATPEGAEGLLNKGIPHLKRTLHRTIDLCAVASEFQLRAVLQIALSYAFPLNANKGSFSIRVSDPDLREIFCPNLAITVRAAVRARFKESILSVTKNGTVRFRAPGEVRVEYRAPVGSDQPESPADVWSAQACLTDIDVVGLDLEGVPNWLDSTLIQDCLNGDLPGWTGCRDVVQEMCRDITGLVQAYVAPGRHIVIGNPRPWGQR